MPAEAGGVSASKPRIALLPCPFCGSAKAPRFWKSADLHEGSGDNDDGSSYHGVVCRAKKPRGPGGCGASGGFQITRELAAEFWNRRA